MTPSRVATLVAISILAYLSLAARSVAWAQPCTTPSQCDDGLPCSLDECDPDTSHCVHTPRPGVLCRAAVAGVGGAETCDVAEYCPTSGFDCPADSFRDSSFPCRTAVAGVGGALTCDVLERCTGSSAQCPADSFQPAGTPCRPAASACDKAETCTGTAAACPADGRQPAGTVCRPAVPGSGGALSCDVAEVCPGGDDPCPPDDTFAPTTTLCREVQGDCDAPEYCNGTATCPSDLFRGSDVVCRAEHGFCNPAERCAGDSATCPEDVIQPDNTSCDDGNDCTFDDVCVEGLCLGSGDCPDASCDAAFADAALQDGPPAPDALPVDSAPGADAGEEGEAAGGCSCAVGNGGRSLAAPALGSLLLGLYLAVCRRK